MRIVFLFFAVILTSGCIATPQTRDELKKTAREHPGLSVLETYVTNRGYEQVTATLERKWQFCYSVVKQTTRSEGGMQTMNVRDTFHPKWRKVNGSKTEMTIQMTTKGEITLNKVPPGGMYKVALDIERVGNKTKLSWYSARGWREHWERNKKWSDGKDVGCEE